MRIFRRCVILGRRVACALLLSMLAAAGTADAAAPGAEQNYPTKPIRLIVPQAPGGSNDPFARQVGNYLAARSAPDGYTLLLVSSAYSMNPAVRKVPYDPLRAFEWVALLGSGPIVLVVGPSLGVNSVKELIAAAKAKP